MRHLRHYKKGVSRGEWVWNHTAGYFNPSAYTSAEKNHNFEYMSINSTQYQERLIQYLYSIKHGPLNELVIDSCSELSRMVGCWLLENEDCTVHVCKGTNLKTLDAHDLLIIETKGEYQVWDPSIWQIHEDAESIFVLTAMNLNQVIHDLSNIYGGRWDISETLSATMCSEHYSEWLDIVQKNILG